MILAEPITKDSIVRLLKTARLANKLSVEEVADKLNLYGFKIAPKSLYNYETGNSMPQVPMFLTLCLIYGIDNPVEAVTGEVAERPKMTEDEEEALSLYRDAPKQLQEAAKRVLDPAAKQDTAIVKKTG